jgi:hypothetical protein
LTKNILTWEPEYDFEVISIVSPLKNYRLCWLLNNALNFDFSLYQELEVQWPRKKKTGYFSMYHYYDDIDKMNYYLIANKSDGLLLLGELKNVDYLLKLQGFLASELKADILEAIKKISLVDAVFNTQLSELKNKELLLF